MPFWILTIGEPLPLPRSTERVLCSGLRALVRLARPLGYRRRQLISLRLKALNLFDTIAPTYNHEHTPDEVMSWYREVGSVDVRNVSISRHRLDEGGFAIIGPRP